jgi:hypothetical protein
MGSFERKFKRKQKREEQKAFEDGIDMMVDKIPEECNACLSPFDRTNPDQLSTWRIVVRKKQKKVNLYCPPCWDGAVEMVKDIEKDLKNKDV